MAKRKGRWLRNICVNGEAKRDHPTFRLPEADVEFPCIVETYRLALRRKVRTTGTVQVNIWLSDSIRRPRLSPESLFEGSDIAQLYWPFKFKPLIDAPLDDWPRIMLPVMHAALLWAAKQRGWAIKPFKEAYSTVISSGYRFFGEHRKTYRSPDRRYRLTFHYDMDRENFRLIAVVTDRQGGEVCRKQIFQAKPILGPLINLFGKCRWLTPTRFLYQRRWFHPTFPRRRIVSFARELRAHSAQAT